MGIRVNISSRTDRSTLQEQEKPKKDQKDPSLIQRTKEKVLAAREKAKKAKKKEDPHRGSVEDLVNVIEKLPVIGNAVSGAEAIQHLIKGATTGDKSEYVQFIASGIKTIPGADPVGQLIEDLVTGVKDAGSTSKKALEWLDAAKEEGGALDQWLDDFEKLSYGWKIATATATEAEKAEAELEDAKEKYPGDYARVQKMGGIRQYLPSFLQEEDDVAAAIETGLETGAETGKAAAKNVDLFKRLIKKAYDLTPTGKVGAAAEAAGLKDYIDPIFVKTVHAFNKAYPKIVEIFSNLKEYTQKARDFLDEVVEEASEWLGVAHHTPEEKSQAKNFFTKNPDAAKMCKVLGGCEDVKDPGEKAGIKEVYAARNNTLYEKLLKAYAS